MDHSGTMPTMSRRDTLKVIGGAAVVATGGFVLRKPANAQTRVIRMGTIKVPHWAASWIVPELMPKTIEVKLVEFKTSLEIIAALNAGSLDVGNAGYWHLMRMLDEGANVKAITGVSSGGTRLVVRTGVSVGSWPDFRGHVCGVARGTTQEVQFLLGLKKHGLSRTDINYRDLGGNPAIHVTALQQGQADSVSMWEPFGSKVIEEKIAYQFGDASALYEDSFRVNSLMFVKAEYLESNRDALQSLVQAQVKATDRLLQNPAEFLELGMKLSGFSREVITLANRNSFLEFALRMNDGKKLAAAVHELGYTKTDVTPKLGQAFDYSILARVTGKTPKELGA
jgi:ABC-type nitrate/sulfonate/bicarbonate transport system substrate-binding protein